jgi:hypothetical protein
VADAEAERGENCLREVIHVGGDDGARAAGERRFHDVSIVGVGKMGTTRGGRYECFGYFPIGNRGSRSVSPRHQVAH